MEFYPAGQQQQQQQQQVPNASDYLTTAHPIYSTPEQLQMYPNLEQILAQYTLGTTNNPASVGAKSPSVASLRFQAPNSAAASLLNQQPGVTAPTPTAAELYNRSVSTTSIGKRSVTSVTSFNTNGAASGTASSYSNALIETIFR